MYSYLIDKIKKVPDIEISEEISTLLDWLDTSDRWGDDLVMYLHYEFEDLSPSKAKLLEEYPDLFETYSKLKDLEYRELDNIIVNWVGKEEVLSSIQREADLEPKLEKLELPRSRTEIISTIKTAFDTNEEFVLKVQSILNMVGIPTNDIYDVDYLIARDILLFGEALVVDGAILDPSTYTVRLAGSKQIFFMDDRVVVGDIKYYVRKASPYDIRGTSFFHPLTLKPYDNRNDYDIAAHLLLILEK